MKKVKIPTGKYGHGKMDSAYKKKTVKRKKK
jgi:hypothetical protein